MEETEFDRQMQAVLPALREALDWYEAAYRDGRDRTVEGQKLAASYYRLCSIDNGFAKTHREGSDK